MHEHSAIRWWRSRGGVALVGFGFIVAFYVLREHYALALGVLPYLLLLACPLMHLFMHHGHGGHNGGTGSQAGSVVQDAQQPGAGL